MPSGKTVIRSLRHAAVSGNTETRTAGGTKQAGAAQSVGEAAEAAEHMGLRAQRRVPANVPLIAVENAGSGARIVARRGRCW